MKKISTKIKEKKLYDVKALLGNIAAVKSATGKSGLINVKTDEILGTLDDYAMEIYRSDELIFLIKVIADEEGRRKFVSICDTRSERLLAENWLMTYDDILSNHSGYYKVGVLQNPNTKKYHILNRTKYRDDFGSFDTGYDEVELLETNNADEKFLTLTKNGKKAIYSTTKGLITDFIYDDIERHRYATIFTINGKKFFVYKKLDDKNKSPMFDEITYEGKYTNLLYCKSDSNIIVYFVSGWFCKQLFILPRYDSIKQVSLFEDYVKREYILLVMQNNNYGLISGTVGNKEDSMPFLQKLVSTSYDKIDCCDDEYYLHKVNKVGLLVGNSKNYSTLDPIYDDIVHIQNTPYYILYNGGECSLINLTDKKIILSGCSEIVETSDNKIIFEQKGKKGIIIRIKSSDEYKIFYGFDSIKALDKYGEYLLITKNGKQGFFYKDDVLFEPIYESISFNGAYDEDFENVFNSKILYFSLKKNDNDFDFVRFHNKVYGPINERIEHLNSQNMTNVLLFNKIIVCSDSVGTSIYDYDGNPLKMFFASATIKEHYINIADRKEYIYEIDGIFYICKDTKLEKVPSEMVEEFITAYESDFGTIVINSLDQQIHDETCKIIEEYGSENIDKTLISYYQNNRDIQNKYPTLVKKIK